ncbi:hypothetical protein N0G65_000621 [Providencia rettgeri]|nr:hypothetical protein [Providencia rettgeri]
MITLRFLSLYVLTGICSSIFNLSYANSIVYPLSIEKGTAYSFPLNVHSNYPTAGGGIYTITDYAALFMIDTKYNLNGMSSSCLSSSLFSWTSDNRYYGITVAKDTVIAIVNATSDSTAFLRNGNVTPTQYAVYSGGGSWDAKGVFTPTFPLPSGKTWCSGKPFDNTMITQINSPLPGVEGTLTGTLVLYAGPNADVGLINTPQLYWNLTLRGTEIASSQSIKVITGLECTVSAPPVINFGQVNLWNFAGNSTGLPGGARRDVLAVSDGELGINCNGDSSSKTSGVLTLKGVTRKYTNDLEVRMDATNSLAPATVRASFMNRTSACNSTGTNFGPTTGKPDADKVQIAELSAGQTNIPYRFSLCSFPEEGINIFGSASATATMTLNWD